MNKSPKKLSCHFHEVLNKLINCCCCCCCQKRDCSKCRNNRLNNQMTDFPSIANFLLFCIRETCGRFPFPGVAFPYPCIKYTIKKHAILIAIPLHGNPCIFASVFSTQIKRTEKKMCNRKRIFYARAWPTVCAKYHTIKVLFFS